MSLIRRSTKSITVSVSAVDLTYSSGDVIGVVQTMTDAVLDGSSGAELRSLVVLDATNQKSALDLVFFHTAPLTSIGIDGAAYALADSDLSKVIGRISVAAASYVSSGTASAEATVSNIGLLLQSAAKNRDIYVAIISRGTPTYAISDLSVKLVLERY